MKFYYQNNMGDYGVFSEKDLIKAIYSAWNVEADLYLVNEDVKKLDVDNLHKQATMIFCPLEDNEFNSELLKPFGYCMEDGKKHREIKEIKTGKVIRYDWSEVGDLF